MIFYILLAFALTVLAVFYPRMDAKSRNLLATITIGVLVIFAGLRGSHVDLDYIYVYDHFINLIPSSDYLFHDFSGYLSHLPAPELSFCVLVSLLKSVTSYTLPVVIFIYAFFSLPIKVKAISRLTTKETFGLALLIFFANLFLLQEMTQIRAALAVSIFMLALPSVIDRNWKRYFTLVFIAFLFHRSAFLAFPLYFFKTDSINFKWWLAIICTLFVLAFIRFDVVSILLDYNVPVLHDKLSVYMRMQDWMKFDVNLFNVFILLQLLVSCFLYWKRDLIVPHCPCFYLLLKVNLISVMLFYFFVRIPVFSFRLSDFFSCATIILYPMVYYVLKPKAVSQFAVIGMAWCMLLVNLFHNNLLDDYYMVFFE